MSSVLIIGFMECVSVATLLLPIIISSDSGSREIRDLYMFLCSSDQVSLSVLFIKFSQCVIYSLECNCFISILVLYPAINYIH
jgi:hypothetical protein